MDEKFNVLLTGQLVEDMTLAEVLTNLATLFKISKEHASDLLAQAPVVIKASIDKSSCDKYITPVELAGARCRIEPASQPALNLAATPAATIKAADAPAKTPAQTPKAVDTPVKTQDPTPGEAPAAPDSADLPTQDDPRSKIFSPDESVQFEGSVVRQVAASFPNFYKDGRGRLPSNLYCFITNKRVLLYAEDELLLDLPEPQIEKITKVRLGSTIWHGGCETTLAFADKVRGEAALARLKSGSSENILPPTKHKEDRGSSTLWGWLIATSPLIGSTINAGLIKFYSVRVIMLWYAICAGLALIDRLTMKRQGRSRTTRGPGFPYFVPWYLFARARAFGHSKAYAIIGCIIFAAALAAEALHFYQRYVRGC